jgi:hypothetical protein
MLFAHEPQREWSAYESPRCTSAKPASDASFRNSHARAILPRSREARKAICLKLFASSGNPQWQAPRLKSAKFWTHPWDGVIARWQSVC